MTVKDDKPECKKEDLESALLAASVARILKPKTNIPNVPYWELEAGDRRGWKGRNNGR